MVPQLPGDRLSNRPIETNTSGLDRMTIDPSTLGRSHVPLLSAWRPVVPTNSIQSQQRFFTRAHIPPFTVNNYAHYFVMLCTNAGRTLSNYNVFVKSNSRRTVTRVFFKTHSIIIKTTSGTTLNPIISSAIVKYKLRVVHEVCNIMFCFINNINSGL